MGVVTVASWSSVGISKYRGDVYGVEQFVESSAARQILALIAFIATLPGCRRMTVNEGRRTRPRQKTLRQRFEAFLRGGPYAPLAAVLYTSRHDEVNHGNAADLGGPNGESLNAAEIAALKKYGPDFGVKFTGLTFSPPEPWHVEADGKTPIPRYALASSDSSIFEPALEDDMFSDLDRAKLDLIIGTLSSEDSGTGKGGIRGTVNQILVAEEAPDPQAVHKLVRVKSRPDVFHSVDFHTLRGISSEKVLNVLGWQLQQIGALDTRPVAAQVITVDGIDDLKGFGALIGPRPLGADGKPDLFYASL